MDIEENQEIKKISYSSPLPYPKVCACGQNPAFGRTILDNIGGSNSEISAISLYIYNNFITDCYEEIAYSFHQISIVEMHHLKIFGTLSKQLGMDPRLWTQKGRRFYYWTPSYNRYPGKLPELLCNAIDGEKAAIEKYTYQADRIDDPNIVENLQRIILDEQLHIDLMNRLYQKYCT